MPGFVLLLLMQPASAGAPAASLIAEIAQSGRVLDLSDTRERVADPRTRIAPVPRPF